MTVQNDALLLASPLLESAAQGGILAVGGTGSVCLAVRKTGDGQVDYLGRRGGLGFLLGDEGSGQSASVVHPNLAQQLTMTLSVESAYHVGRTLLRLLLNAEDSGDLDRKSAFVKALLAYWKVDDVDQLLERVVSGRLVSAQGTLYLTLTGPTHRSTRSTRRWKLATQRTTGSYASPSVRFAARSEFRPKADKRQWLRQPAA